MHIEAKSHDDYVQIDIADTGIGIPAYEPGSIFGEFFRASYAIEALRRITGTEHGYDYKAAPYRRALAVKRASGTATPLVKKLSQQG